MKASGAGISDRRRHWLLQVGALALAVPLNRAARAAAAAEQAHQHPLPAIKGVKASVEPYDVPDVVLVRDDGSRVSLRREMDDGRPVALNFIYTTCPGICPMMSQVFSEFQTRLGNERERIHMMSISIDPEQDTPARLREYAQHFVAGRQWQHYTGTVAASEAVQRAFNAYRGDKMNHDPLTLMRPAPGQPWLRLDGFATGADLARQYASLSAICSQNLR